MGRPVAWGCRDDAPRERIQAISLREPLCRVIRDVRRVGTTIGTGPAGGRRQYSAGLPAPTSVCSHGGGASPTHEVRRMRTVMLATVLLAGTGLASTGNAAAPQNPWHAKARELFKHAIEVPTVAGRGKVPELAR